ncbi:FAD-dependent oxidoreductase [Aspergillus fijiensis CBS 313.89]|uniref:FAD/NAD(P)-binding domain-containing protein n=1 Tax=Aspergillus fijiensis CBS 313.89 TaxID=1448319 RepID=A0A8G1RW60_9EURO|nr:FAD/NAD(P)-binding domain-containing protein [Aspergillus fijiensis CBS 313.89]RAK81172.1 FAD/NAD(P)-binding domain-containing protein [Aspergillus fijiensis CBS 313.89]
MGSIGEEVQVIIVGLGIVGLSAAIECREKGHKVRAFEKSDILKPIGDCIGLQSNATRIIGRWGNGAIHEALRDWVVTAKEIQIHNSSGGRIIRQDLSEVCKQHNYLLPRSELIRVMYEHARKIGVEMTLGVDVSDPVEDEQGASVLVTARDGTSERVRADCVICSDGVHSKMRQAIMRGQPVEPRPSGYAAFRALVDIDRLRADPEASWVFEGVEEADRFDVFFLSGAQIALQSCNKGKVFSWFCIHQDTRNLLDVWTSTADPNEMLNLIKDWPIGARLWSVIRHTLPQKFINYPLLNHEPLSHWVSSGGRLILIGDAAHPLSPAAGQGASQGIEDANVLATTLSLAGQDQVPLALRVAERIRYARASAVQLISHRSNEGWRNQDWDAFAADEENVASLPLETWIFGHDSQAYTEREFERVARAVREGQKYRPTNLPEELWGELSLAQYA